MKSYLKITFARTVPQVLSGRDKFGDVPIRVYVVCKERSEPEKSVEEETARQSNNESAR